MKAPITLLIPTLLVTRSQTLSRAVSLLSNVRLCADACEKFPGEFAHSVGLFNKIILGLSVYALTFVPRTPPKHHRFRPRAVCGGLLFVPPSTSARVQSRFDFVEIGDMYSNYQGEFPYGLELQAGTTWCHELYTRAQYICTIIYDTYRYQRFACVRTRCDVLMAYLEEYTKY